MEDELLGQITNQMRDSDPASASLVQVLGEVVVERLRQDEKWGGPTVDDSRDLDYWPRIISSRAGQMTLLPANRDGLEESRRLMVEVAAIAIATVQAIDRVLE